MKKHKKKHTAENVFLSEGQKTLAEGQRLLRELDVGPHIRPYLLVINNFISIIRQYFIILYFVLYSDT